MKWHQSHMFRGLGNVDTFREYAALESCLFIGERPYISGGSGLLASITTRRRRHHCCHGVGRAPLDWPAWRFRAEADPSSLLRRTPPYRMLLLGPSDSWRRNKVWTSTSAASGVCSGRSMSHANTAANTHWSWEKPWCGTPTARQQQCVPGTTWQPSPKGPSDSSGRIMVCHLASATSAVVLMTVGDADTPLHPQFFGAITFRVPAIDPRQCHS